MAVLMARFCSTTSIIPIVTNPAKIKKTVMIAFIVTSQGADSNIPFFVRGRDEWPGAYIVSAKRSWFTFS
jgi:hypothetical protein